MNNKESFKLKNILIDTGTDDTGTDDTGTGTDGTDDTGTDDTYIYNNKLSFDSGIFILILIMYLWAIIYLFRKWKELPDWARIFAVLALINQNIGGPIATLIIIYIVTSSNQTKL